MKLNESTTIYKIHSSRNRKVSPTEIKFAIEQIIKIIAEGYSIVYARKKVCGGQHAALNRALSASPWYVEVLNKYMEDRKYNGRFTIVSNELTQDPRMICARKRT